MFLSGTNICKNGIVQSPNPYDTDLPVIEDAREFSYFFFFRFCFVWSEESGLFFVGVVVVVGILSRDV